MKDTNEDYVELVKGVGGALIILALVLWFLLASGCKILQSKEISQSDTTSVKKETELSAKVDTSKSKSEVSHTKETVYYPQPIYIEGKNGESKIVFVPQSVKESGSEKQESSSYKFEDFRKEILDSLNANKKDKTVETKAKVGPSFIEWILIAGLAFVLLKNYLPFKITKT